MLLSDLRIKSQGDDRNHAGQDARQEDRLPRRFVPVAFRPSGQVGVIPSEAKNFPLSS